MRRADDRQQDCRSPARFDAAYKKPILATCGDLLDGLSIVPSLL
jgi:hypothetical protein